MNERHTSPAMVSVLPRELLALQEVMRELQLSVSRYYAETAGDGDLGLRVRSFLVAAQSLNDLLSNEIDDAQTFRDLLAAERNSAGGVIEGVKFARNVSQHLLHIIRPSDDIALVGGTLGFRVYAEWDGIPAEVVSRLRPGTQALEPQYVSQLQGREVTGTMMSALRFFHAAVPQVVHRDARGEWTGFPLMSQPGVNTPIHPEEPIDPAATIKWMNSRRPGGDHRVVCGQVTVENVPYIYGHTFEGKLSYAPFVETVDQANRDIALGYSYVDGVLSSNFDDVTELHPDAKQGRVLQSRGEILSWASPITSIEQCDDWQAPGIDGDSWVRVVKLQIDQRFPELNFGPRRAQRLYALVPPR